MTTRTDRNLACCDTHGMIDVPMRLVVDPDNPNDVEVHVDIHVDGVLVDTVVDTGAATTIVPARSALAGLPSLGTATSHAASGAEIVADRIRVGSLAIGAASAEEIVVERSRDPESRALLGIDVLDRWCVGFLFSRRTIQLGGPPPIPSWRHLDRIEGGQPVVDVELAGRLVRAVRESGASSNVVDEGWAASIGLQTTEAPMADGRDAGGSSIAASSTALPTHRISGREFATCAAVAIDLSPLDAHVDVPMQLIVGRPTLSQADWWFDFPRARWAFSEGAGRGHRGGTAS